MLYPKSDEEYKCQVEHAGLSKPLRATAQISIYRSPSSPVIEGYKSGDIVSFQEKLTLKCTSANGYPPPTVVWLRNGVEVDRNSTQSRSGTEMVNTLSFVVQQTDNLATFTCQVANLMTPIPLQQSITLNVLCKSAQPKSVSPSFLSLSLCLQCFQRKFKLSPPRKFFWWALKVIPILY